MELDKAIIATYDDFEMKVEEILLQPQPAKAFCRVVVRLHGAPVASEIILDRLIALEERGLIPSW